MLKKINKEKELEEKKLEEKKTKMNILTTADASNYLKISTRSLQRMRDTGRIKYYQDNRVIRYKEEDLLEYLEKNVMEPFDLKGGRNV